MDISAFVVFVSAFVVFFGGCLVVCLQAMKLMKPTSTRQDIVGRSQRFGTSSRARRATYHEARDFSFTAYVAQAHAKQLSR